jgi:hypothetical protein
MEEESKYIFMSPENKAKRKIIFLESYLEVWQI